MANIYRVIQINLNQLFFQKISILSLTCQQSVSKRYHSDKHLWEFYLQDGGKNQLTDVEQNFATVSSDWYRF